MIAHSTVTISGDLIRDAKESFKLSLDYVLKGQGVRHGTNAYTPHAFTAYVASVASIEAFINETLLGNLPRTIFPDSSLWIFGDKTLENLNIQEKLIIVPRLLFDITFSRDTQPYQDFSLLVKVRNAIVHFKMGFDAPKCLPHLSQRGIALTAENKVNADYSWPHKLSCTEGIRWAHNTACKVVQKLIEFVPEEKFPIPKSMAGNFIEISDQFVQEWFKKNGLM
ncbi:MAG: hypothetical protein HYZ11_18750 [Candidatus Tectomicrobia bacterium]|uniref:Uncharacterized protein n=1 Tax=Tectimicrobiota bacterium TaxID=2528274 RepID=A0A932MNS0_UNCTE|nr:hypothetical protein [Candidatus Tectomicrobia bacterium]